MNSRYAAFFMLSSHPQLSVISLQATVFTDVKYKNKTHTAVPQCGIPTTLTKKGATGRAESSEPYRCLLKSSGTGVSPVKPLAA